MLSTTLNAPLQIGAVHVGNRIALSTGHPAFRADACGVPAGQATHFAPASLVLASSTAISPSGIARSGMPGLYQEAQLNGWQTAIRAVHQSGSLLALPLTHAGRASHRALQPNQVAPMAPSAGQAASFTSIDNEQSGIRRTLCSEARAMSPVEIESLPDDFRQAAALALKAGADLVEIDAAQGYLLHQFLSPESNQRDDQYGGSVENRLRIVLAVLDAVLQVCPANRLGLALSPVGVFKGLESIDMTEVTLQLADAAQARGLAYLRLVEPDWLYGHQVSDALRGALRQRFAGALLASGAFDVTRSETLIGQGLLDMAVLDKSVLQDLTQSAVTQPA